MNEQANGWKQLVLRSPSGMTSRAPLPSTLSCIVIFPKSRFTGLITTWARETVQNLLVFRFANGMFEPLWSRNFIEYVEITGAEFIRVEERGGYYDHAGAMRDMFQNHLLPGIGDGGDGTSCCHQCRLHPQ